MLTTTRGLALTSDVMRAPWIVPGRPIVLHHGIGTDHGIWADWLPVLAPARRVVRFDMRGFGRSHVPAADHAWTMGEMLDDLMEIVEYAERLSGPGPVHLMGESIGGTIVLAAASRYPNRFSSIAVSNTAHRGPGIGRVAGWREEIAQSGVHAWSRAMMEHRFEPGVLDEAHRSWFEAEQARGAAHVLIGLGEMLAAADLTPELAGFGLPLLVMMPDSSPFVPVGMGSELKALVPSARLAVFPGVRHGLPFSHARECAALVAAFAAEHDPTQL